MTAVTTRDIKDVKKMVRQKLELYMNREKRENFFDPSGHFRTTRKMYKYDLMYRVVNYDVFDKASPRYTSRKKTGKMGTAVEFEHETERDKHKKQGSADDSLGSKKGTGSKDGFIDTIYPKLEETSRRVTLYREADRITKYANEVYNKYDMEGLQTIHHFRPSSSQDHVKKSLDSGYIHNYVPHVGAILHTKSYINFYKEQGLYTGDKTRSKRLQELPMRKHKQVEKEQEG